MNQATERPQDPQELQDKKKGSIIINNMPLLAHITTNQAKTRGFRPHKLKAKIDHI